MRKNVNIFYSWQSDLSRETNEHAIRVEVKKVIPALEEILDKINLNLDEATRNVEGSPEIPSTIIDKISSCDIFICDLTTINSGSQEGRRMPNPNVMFELGYAVSTLGWSRIIMLFNSYYGNYQTELPFDLEKRRIVSYNISTGVDNNGKGDLRAKIKNGLQSILEKDPVKPSESKAKSPNEIRRDKDINNLTELLSNINLPTIDIYIHYLPNRIVDKIFFFLYGVQDVVNSSSFHIYNEELSALINDFISLWEKTLSYSHLFKVDSSNNYILHLPFDVFERRKDEEDFAQLTKDAIDFKTLYNKLIKFIRENYLDIDIDELSNLAGDKYNKYYQNKS